MEERFQCPECEKHFGSREKLEQHVDIVHDGEPEFQEEVELVEKLPDFRKYFNLSFGAGLLIGIFLASAVFSGYLYWDSLDHRTEVPVTVVTCDNCSYDKFRDATGRMFNTDYREVNYQSEKGQKLVEKYSLNYVPGFIFDKKVEEAENFERIKASLVEFDDAYVLPDKGVRVAQRVSEGIALN